MQSKFMWKIKIRIQGADNNNNDSINNEPELADLLRKELLENCKGIYGALVSLNWVEMWVKIEIMVANGWLKLT